MVDRPGFVEIFGEVLIENASASMISRRQNTNAGQVTVPPRAVIASCRTSRVASTICIPFLGIGTHEDILAPSTIFDETFASGSIKEGKKVLRWAGPDSNEDLRAAREGLVSTQLSRRISVPCRRLYHSYIIRFVDGYSKNHGTLLMGVIWHR